ncbi:MBL fold metallo-hydrolase [Bacteroides sp. 51]|uniref:MBL fold metallo-hydrolase n=1 Tax=Bacteroides sp. 51 TaxID=2302938 RepID=UPI0013D2CAD7|nr:MBL fold metallo-hydrolase [Bacteroides sp. 51]NDV82723.1 MBL fold metallo-hydrolase [Bacteroides sp. 51]
MIKRLTALFMASVCTLSLCYAQNNNIFSYKVGDYEVILLSEGQSDNKTDKLIGATPEILRETVPDGTYKTAVNTFLVKTPDKIYLIDTGFGRNLWTNLDAIGVSPEQINVVVLTHMHGDHTGGTLKDGVVAFPNAHLILSAPEYVYWIEEAKQENASRIVNLYGERVQVVTPEQLEKKQGDGIYFIEAYGHTPGHMACLLQSGDEELLIWADLTHAMAVQMPYPEIALTYDSNPEMAVNSRKRILEYVAENEITIAGMHIAYPAMGEIKASPEKGYLFTPCSK